MAAFSIEQAGYLQNPFFNISIEQRYYTRNSKGELIKQTQQIQLEPCTLEHFTLLLSQPDIDFPSQYKELDLGNWLCPKKDFQFHLSGTYTSQEFGFVKIIVNDCNDQVHGYENWKPTPNYINYQYLILTLHAQHNNKETLISLIKDNSNFKYIKLIQLLIRTHLNNIYIPYKKQKSAFYMVKCILHLYQKNFQDKQIYFIENTNFIMIYHYCHFSIYLVYLVDQKVIYILELALLNQRQIEEKELLVRRSDDYRDLTELGRDTDTNYAIIYMRRSQFTEYVDRRFIKIDELLSFLGGFLQIMMAGFGIIIIYYNKLSMLVALSNQIYIVIFFIYSALPLFSVEMGNYSL